jgi:hypothetical protein
MSTNNLANGQWHNNTILGGGTTNIAIGSRFQPLASSHISTDYSDRPIYLGDLNLTKLSHDMNDMLPQYNDLLKLYHEQQVQIDLMRKHLDELLDDRDKANILKDIQTINTALA